MLRPPPISPANIYEKCQGEAGGRRSPLTSSTWLSTPKLGPDVTGARATGLADGTDRVNVCARAAESALLVVQEAQERKKNTCCAAALAVPCRGLTVGFDPAGPK